MRVWLPVVLAVPFLVAGCPGLLSDWKISGGDAVGGSSNSWNPDAARDSSSDSGGSAGSSGSGGESRADGSSSGGTHVAPTPEEASISHDAMSDAPPLECVTDLSDVGTGDFQISFTVTTTTTGVQMSLVEQLAACIACGENGAGWAVTMTATGAVEIETSDGTPSRRVFNIGGGPVNDGLPHRVVAGRTSGMLWIGTDEAPISPPKSDPNAFGALVPLTVGMSHCGSSDCTFYQSLNGSVRDVCVSRS